MLSHVGRFSGKKLRPALVLLIATRRSARRLPARFPARRDRRDDPPRDAHPRRRHRWRGDAPPRGDGQCALVELRCGAARGHPVLAGHQPPRQAGRLAVPRRADAGGQHALRGRDPPEPPPAGRGRRPRLSTTRSSGRRRRSSTRPGASWPRTSPARTAERVRACATYGLELGTSFQIIDDCLDLFGDEAEVGKSLGTDLKGGKVTLPVILALASSDEGARTRWRSGCGTRTGTRRSARTSRPSSRRSGSLEESMQRARSHAERAKAAARTMLDGQAAADLDAIADFVVARRK